MQLDFEETHRRGGFPDLRSRRSARGRIDDPSAELARMVEAEIIPRLMLAHRARDEARADPPPPAPPDAAEVAALADIALAGDARQLSRHVDAVSDRGVGLDVVLLDLLAPAARLLGERWLSDETSFADVTIGLARLHRLLHELVDVDADLDASLAPSPRTRRALLVPAEGEQHSFGLLMVETFLRRAGWEVWPGAADAARLVRRRHFDVVGISASSEARLDAVAGLIREVRRASCNAGVAVLVGGPVFVAHPEYAALVGADATGCDAREACRAAERLAERVAIKPLA